jgi:hypothetical protein
MAGSYVKVSGAGLIPTPIRNKAIEQRTKTGL